MSKRNTHLQLLHKLMSILMQIMNNNWNKFQIYKQMNHSHTNKL